MFLTAVLSVVLTASVLGWSDQPTGGARLQTAAASVPAAGLEVIPSPTRTRRWRSRPTATPTTAEPTVQPTTSPPAPSGSGSAPAVAPEVGLPAGTVLHPLAGSLITQPGTVIDGADVEGGLVIAAEGVVIRRSRISGDDDLGVFIRSGSVTIEDTTISGFADSVGGDNYTATRVEVTGATDDGFKIGNNVLIQDSWCHDLDPSGLHSDCGQVQSGVRNVMIARNWFDAGTGVENSALFLAPDLGPSTSGPLVVRDNVLGGGNYTLQCVDGADGLYLITGIVIENNHFLRNSRYGPLRVNVLALLLGNVYQDNNLPILF